jgi:hypothetical protein
LLILLVGALAPLKNGRYSAWPAARRADRHLVVPVLGYYVFTYVKPAYQGVRHLILVSPAFYLLLARGVIVIGERWRLAALGVLILLTGGMAYSTSQYFWNPHYQKDDWRGMVRYVEANAWARDVVLVNNTFVRPVLDFYNQGDDLLWLSAPELSLNLMTGPDQKEMARTLSELAAQHPRIWYVPGLPQDGRDAKSSCSTGRTEHDLQRNQFHGRGGDENPIVHRATSSSMCSRAVPPTRNCPGRSGLQRGVKLRRVRDRHGG